MRFITKVQVKTQQRTLYSSVINIIYLIPLGRTIPKVWTICPANYSMDGVSIKIEMPTNPNIFAFQSSYNIATI